MDNINKVYADIESELTQIFAELGMDDPKYSRGSAWLKSLVLIAIRYPTAWTQGHLEYIGNIHNINRERVRVILWRTAAEKWSYQCWKNLSEKLGYSVKPRFTIVSKPNAYEFISLLADNLRIKYQIQPQDKDFAWSKVFVPVISEQPTEGNENSVLVDDDDFED